MTYFSDFYPSNKDGTFEQASLLCDVDSDGFQEYVLCLDGHFIVTLNGQAEVLWSKEFDFCRKPLRLLLHTLGKPKRFNCNPDVIPQNLHFPVTVNIGNYKVRGFSPLFREVDCDSPQ